MTKFEIAQEFTARWEGGLSDDPNDRGGITNYGCSLAFVKGVAKEDRAFVEGLGIKLPVKADTIRSLTYEQACALLKHEFWDSLGLDDFPLPVAIALYDGAVNSGPARSVRWMQTAWNRCNSRAAPLAIDGILGPMSRSAFKAAGRSEAIWQTYARDSYLTGVCDKNPSQKVFAKGWQNRIKDLRETLKRLPDA